MAKRKIVRRSMLGALLAGWWAEKKRGAGHPGSVTLTLYDALVLAGLALAWALDRYAEGKEDAQVVK